MDVSTRHANCPRYQLIPASATFIRYSPFTVLQVVRAPSHEGEASVRIISVGVDFGTSNTVVAVIDEARAPHVLSIRSRSGTARALPSVLCFKPNERNRHDRPDSSAGMDAITDYPGRAGLARLVQSTKSFLGSRNFVDTRIFSHTRRWR